MVREASASRTIASAAKLCSLVNLLFYLDFGMKNSFSGLRLKCFLRRLCSGGCAPALNAFASADGAIKSFFLHARHKLDLCR